MTLHQNQVIFKAALAASAAYFKIPEIYIEKDYWVTFALKQIFTSEKVKDIAVFKGGTALSKCYKIIDRFSEDIDIVVLHDADESGNSVKRKLKLITSSVGNNLPCDTNHLLENKKGKVRKLVYNYEKQVLQGVYGQVRDQIVLEVSSLGSPHPSEFHDLHAMITQFIGTTENLELIKQFELEPFKVRVLGLERTFCEKIISLVRFSYTENPLLDLSGKVRHTYDLHLLLQQQSIKDFFSSQDFEKMLIQVGKDDYKAIPNDKKWLSNHPKDAIIFKELENSWTTLKKTYNTTFKELVTGDFPNDTAIYDSLFLIKDKLNKFNWELN